MDVVVHVDASSNLHHSQATENRFFAHFRVSASHTRWVVFPLVEMSKVAVATSFPTVETDLSGITPRLRGVHVYVTSTST